MPRSIWPARSVPPASTAAPSRVSSSSASSTDAGPRVACSRERLEDTVTASAATPAARRPVACANAFAIAAAVGTIGGSPSPFEPTFGRFASGMCGKVDHDLGHVCDRRESCSRRGAPLTGTPVVGSTTSSSVSAKAIPCSTPPSTWLDAVSGLTIRPTSWTATIRSTRTSPSAGVDGDLRDLAAERVDDEAVRVRAARAGAVDRGVAELLRHLGHVGVDRAVGRADPAVPYLEISRSDLEDVARELKQRLAHLRRGRADGRHHRRRRLGAARDRARRRCGACRRRRRGPTRAAARAPPPRPSARPSASRCRCPGFPSRRSAWPSASRRTVA